MATALRTPEAELLRRLRTRDRDAWEELYAEYQPRLRAFAYRLAADVEKKSHFRHTRGLQTQER